MATAFLRKVAEHVFQNYKDKTGQLCIVLPGRRGAIFLKKHLAAVFRQTIWVPEIISAEDMIQQMSGTTSPEDVDLMCMLYDSYRETYGNDAEPFDSFARWGQLILQDFNEIDRYLADPSAIYENLRDIKEIENWSLGQEALTQTQQEYLRFMSGMGALYRHFTSALRNRGQAYQGLAYRMAVEKLEDNAFTEKYKGILLCGFNALNEAERKIFASLISSRKAEVLWDADHYYFDDPDHEAGLFLRDNFRRFPQKSPSFISNDFTEPREINIVTVPGQNGQAQVARQSLQDLMKKGVPMEKVVLVLANEKLLGPMLQQLPSNVGPVNITMEHPIRYSATYAALNLLLDIQVAFSKQTRHHKTIYHNDLIALLRMPLINLYLKQKNQGTSVNRIVTAIHRRNISFADIAVLRELSDNDDSLVQLVSDKHNVSSFCSVMLGFLQTLSEAFREEHGHGVLEREYVEILLRHCTRLDSIVNRYIHFHSIHAFRQLFVQVVGQATVPFVGEPLAGLQIMGVLETRTLDFDHVIMLGVNEGILPSGKTSQSFLPNDLKRAFGLPLYTEKDAVYAYHFYRLLQRTQSAVLICDSEPDTFGKGERSRFITQLQLELPIYNSAASVKEQVAVSSASVVPLDNTIVISKTPDILARITDRLTKEDEYSGLSPSALITYKECSLRYYFRYPAGLKEVEAVEESAEAGTFGSILHKAIEDIYRPVLNTPLTETILRGCASQIDHQVEKGFQEFTGNRQLTGKSVLQKEVMKVYLQKLISNDIRLAKNQTLTLLHLEQSFRATLPVRTNSGNITVSIQGKIDRIDRLGNVVRIIDYKSSVRDSDQFTFAGFDSLFHDPNTNKQLQLMMYAWLLYRNKVAPATVLKPCIVSFRHFNKEPFYILSGKEPIVFTEELLTEFESELSRFIGHLFDEGLTFAQTTDTDLCEYCAYRTICNR